MLAWAFAGIGVKHAAVSPVAPAAWLAAGYVLALAVLSLLRGRRQQPSPALAS